MDPIENVTAAVQGGRHAPVGTVHVVDPSPLNWLWITYNASHPERAAGAARKRRRCVGS